MVRSFVKSSGVLSFGSIFAVLDLEQKYLMLLCLTENFLFVLHCFCKFLQLLWAVHLFICSQELLWKHTNFSWLNPESLILNQPAFRHQCNVNISFTAFLLLCHPNVSLRPLNNNERSSEGKGMGKKKLLWGLRSVLEQGDARGQLALSLLSQRWAWHITSTAIHSAVLPELTASSNYPGVQQPCSHCCFFNKRSL